MAWPLPNANSARTQAPPPVVPAMATGSVPAATSTAAPTASNANSNTQVSIIDFNPSDAGNPYYLHPSESPALVLVSPALDGSNYYPWARAMKIALSTKNKLAFIDGRIPIPSKDEQRYMVWERCNNIVVSWIVRSISPEIAQSVLWLQSTIAIWKHLEERFSEGDIFRISQIQGQAYQLKQGILSVDQYFTQMKLLWDELLVLRPLPVCACTPKCNCGGYEKFYTYVENDHLSMFLRGLNENYTSTKSQIMLMSPLPTVGRASSLVKQQEREVYGGILSATPTPQMQGPSQQMSPTVGHAFLASFPQNNNFRPRRQNNNWNKKPGPICSHCGYTGHTVDKCYKLHGYPPGYVPRSKGAGAGIL
ncbi:PREDICTED: uncharacterized protein LOC109157807 [Ipomoea nil]|uniref:uncharacterized protein LOC109157807 n=1 Tax=Ipomoea nil TaxID=35883 RepID=UPI000900D98C|nr:PREDICTED: uncharacterized protein LOC109157807 [Ipomoea nil]